MARKQTPTHLKILSGNPGKRPINTEEFVPEIDVKDIKPPQNLTKNAKKIWKDVLNLAPPGMIKGLDFSEMVRFCVSYDLYMTAYDKVQAEGMVMLNEKGVTIPNPWVAIMNKQSEVMASSSSNLGLSPASRSKLRMDGNKKKVKSEKFANMELRVVK